MERGDKSWQTITKKKNSIKNNHEYPRSMGIDPGGGGGVQGTYKGSFCLFSPYF